MANNSGMSDTELKKKLTELGFNPGPITDGTRNLYLRKLKTLGGSTSGGSKPAASPAHSTNQLIARSAGKLPKTPPPDKDKDEKNRTTDTDPSSESESNKVVSNLLSSLYDSSHPSNDTAVIFPDSTVVLVSRAILTTQCPKLIPHLYKSEECYPITVVTLTGRNSLFHVRHSEYIADLKEKIAISQGIMPQEQRLVFMGNELADGATIGSCSLEPGATVHLVMITTVEAQLPPFSLPGNNPGLSIGHLRLELGLERFDNGGAVQSSHLILPPSTAHLLHVYNAPREGFSMFVRLLYIGCIDSTSDTASVVVTFVLCLYFDLSELAKHALSVIKENLSATQAKELLPYAQTIQCQALIDVCSVT